MTVGHDDTPIAYWCRGRDDCSWLLSNHGYFVAAVHETKLGVYRTETPATPVTTYSPPQLFFDVHNAMRHCERVCHATVDWG